MHGKSDKLIYVISSSLIQRLLTGVNIKRSNISRKVLSIEKQLLDVGEKMGSGIN
jgi:hypothetical protein